MKTKILFRSILGVLAVLYFVRIYFYPDSFQVSELAKKLFDNNWEEVLDYIQRLRIQLVVDTIFYFSLIPFFYKFIFTKIDHKKLWQWSIPIAALVSLSLAFANIGIDKLLNKQYYFENNYSNLTEKAFLPAVLLDSFLHIFSIALITASIFFFEHYIIPKRNSLLNKIGLSYWLIIFCITFLFYSILFSRTVSVPIDQLIHFAPKLLENSIYSLIISYIFLLVFVPLKKSAFGRNNIGKYFTVSLGILFASLFSILYSYPFTSGLSDFSLILLTIGLIVLFLGGLNYMLYFINVSKIKSTIVLEENLQKSSSELTLLKSQINPHFLFNSLNTVYALALNEESPKTAHAVQQLSEMMRFMLHENTAEKIELKKEIEYLKNFIELQKLRLDQNQNIQLDIEIDDACEGEIAPMLLIPFVENAFKHGISLKEPSWIKISLSCADKKVHLNVHNSVHKRLEDPEMGKSGIGQENVRKRLAILYPQKHLFQLYDAEDNYEANIKIDLS